MEKSTPVERKNSGQNLDAVKILEWKVHGVKAVRTLLFF
jgi:hypothetical protein